MDTGNWQSALNAAVELEPCIEEIQVVTISQRAFQQYWKLRALLTTATVTSYHNVASGVSLATSAASNCEELLRQYPMSAATTQLVAECHILLGDVRGRLNELMRAESHYRQAVKHLQRLNTPRDQADLARARLRLGHVLSQTRRRDAAQAEFAAARFWATELGSTSTQPDVMCRCLVILALTTPIDEQPLRRLIANLDSRESGLYARYRALGLCRLKDWRLALDEVRRAMSLREGGDTMDWLIESLSLAGLGEMQSSKNRFTQAKAARLGPVHMRFDGWLAVQMTLDELADVHDNLESESLSRVD